MGRPTFSSCLPFPSWISTLALKTLNAIVIIVICLPTEHLGVHQNSLKLVRAFKIELEFASVGF